ncbi:hypothetical protein ITP53_44830 [Nonomuraea sp. K274]|uniref:Uncharacterized protein n=2 Tax=Nonomuraea cypriaca TaxID=1187855 RepID=A0A931AH04_9ACTN|nr:hypothetical protein [Nonomuraea cypriaca]
MTQGSTATRGTLMGVLGAAVIALSACGDLRPATEPAPPAQAATAPGEAAPEESAQEEAGPEESAQEESGQAETKPAASKLTAPGTKLRVGQRAVVPDRKGPVGITVTAIEAGDPAALVRERGRQAKGITPHYIRYTVENVDGTDHSYSSGPVLSVVTADGGGTGAVLTGTMPGCERETAPRDFTQVGASFETCRLTGARTEVEIVGVKFDSDDYRESPLLWRK